MELDFSLVDSLMRGSAEIGDWLGSDATAAVATLLLAAFGIAVGFVAYKLIKRALNKA